MKHYELDTEGRKELEAVENALESGTLKSAPDFERRKKELHQIASNTLNKTRNINIRLSERDLYRLKAKAIEEGIPYQILASSILHKSAATK
jgi:predicted DNA binding CopG/RHH family protein